MRGTTTLKSFINWLARVRIVEKCDVYFDEVMDIFDGVDEWNYEIVPDSVSLRIDGFFNKHGIKQIN